MRSQIMRIVDANCNRISEGLRFLEDISRFIFNDQALSQQIRNVRHTIARNIGILGNNPISERDADGDVGATFDPAQQLQDMPSLITANAKRIEEGLRIIEELAKLPELNVFLRSADFQQLRFNVYTIERNLIDKLLRKTTAQKIRGLYAIIDTAVTGTRDICDIASSMILGGVKVIQLRDKHSTKASLFAIAQQLKQLCQQSGILFIVNDYLDIALAVAADGIQIGQDDLPISAVRNTIPVGMIIGCSVYSIAQAQKAQTGGADYIGVGAIFATPTKSDATIIGLEGLQQIRSTVAIPIVAIGGINTQNIASVMATGVDAAAVISALFIGNDIEKNARTLIARAEANP